MVRVMLLFILGPVTPGDTICKTPPLATFLGVSCVLIVKGVCLLKRRIKYYSLGWTSED